MIFDALIEQVVGRRFSPRLSDDPRVVGRFRYLVALAVAQSDLEISLGPKLFSSDHRQGKIVC